MLLAQPGEVEVDSVKTSFEEVETYQINGFGLKLYDSARLIIVEQPNLIGDGRSVNRITDLPWWALYSKHVIWLIDGVGRIENRAILGDKIKEKMIRGLNSAG